MSDLFTDVPANLATIQAALGISTPTSIRKRALELVVGQSNEKGNGVHYDAATSTYVTVMDYSRFNQQADPISPALTKFASRWPAYIDTMAATQAVAVKIVNGAIGGLGFVTEAVGQYRAWTANLAYYQQRSSEQTGDLGDKGSLLVAGGKLWRCTTGRKQYMFYTSAGGLDSKLITGTQTSGATAPDWSSVTTVGNTISDGTLVWTLVENPTAKAVNSIIPYNNAEFDRLGVLSRAKSALDAAKALGGYDEVWVSIANAQTDAQSPNTDGFQSVVEDNYRAALAELVSWARTTVGADFVRIGLSCWNPLLGNGERYQYDTLDRAWERACNAFAGNSWFARGANLYRTMGLTPIVGPDNIHLTDVGLRLAAADEVSAVIARVNTIIAAPSLDSTYVPTIVGTGTVGQVLSLSTRGRWKGGPTSYTYQWLRDGVAISGATATTYTLVSGDSGKSASLQVTAINTAGSASAASLGKAVA